MTQKNLKEADFTFNQHRADEELVIAESQVPNGKLYAIQNGQPIEVIITSEETQEIAANSTETVTLPSKSAGRVEFMPSVSQESDIRRDADLVVEDGSGTIAPDSTDINVSNVSVDGDFYTSVDVDNTTGSPITVSIYYVQTKGQVNIQKRTAGRGQTEEVLQEESALSLSFSNPYDPDSDKQIQFDGLGQFERLIPEKFKLEIEFYSKNIAAEVQDAPNVRINIPVKSRDIGDFDVPAEELKEQVRQNMG